MLAKRPRVGSRFVWVDQDARRANLEQSADDLYRVIKDFFREEAKKWARKLERKTLPRTPTMDEIRRAVDEAIAEYDWEPWWRVLRPQVRGILEEAYRRGARNAWQVLHEHGVDFRWELVNPRARDYANLRAAELVGRHVLPDGRVVEALDAKLRIDLSTRVQMREDLTRWIGEGRGWAEIARLIEDRQYTGFFPDWRARRIARTEAAFADNAGNLAGYRWAGVTKVRVFDGTVDPPCREANGQEWDLDYAEAHPLAHPHCARQFAAILPERTSGAPKPEHPETGLTPDEIDRFWGDPEVRRRYFADVLRATTDQERAAAMARIDRLVAEYLERAGFPRAPINGLRIEDLKDAAAAKDPGCAILIDKITIWRGAGLRQHTDFAIKAWIHESVHARQPFDPAWRDEYALWNGYEEGLVEGLAYHLATRAGLRPALVYTYFVESYTALADVLGMAAQDLWAQLWTAPPGKVRGALTDLYVRVMQEKGIDVAWEMRVKFQQTADRLFAKENTGVAPNYKALKDAWKEALRG